MKKTLAQKYDQILGVACATKDFAEVKKFEKKYLISENQVSRHSEWSSFSSIFIDGSVWGLSMCEYNLKFSTRYHD